MANGYTLESERIQSPVLMSKFIQRNILDLRLSENRDDPPNSIELRDVEQSFGFRNPIRLRLSLIQQILEMHL
jgi:hypothetical protein